ncbi:phosphoglycolate phosphatase [Siccirubricoccus deserti]|uniref:HAD family phosphatase n=1 Tax=Siccirubricoccus deserti TaxID=2013562 RepID=A0A9X0UE06_9PROT|nr:HAD family phosphatase [Siccirubricoccus deserti]MBC4017037.1 HAD family phosphatase [Siccirubricoccus deserti]GGC56649.1 phosphoglycolate phosphatase [Siccirubricoccus deserti]
MIEAVIFDVDGTLIDMNDPHAASWVETFRRFGHALAPEAVRGQIGKGSDQPMPVCLSRDQVEQRGAEIDAARTALFLRDYLGRAHAFPDVRPLFQWLRAAGQCIILASSTKGEEIKRYREILGVDDLVDGATTSDDAAHSKPAPDVSQVAPREAGCVAIFRDPADLLAQLDRSPMAAG